MIYIAAVLLALAGCHNTTVESGPKTYEIDLNVELSAAKAKMATLLPENVCLGRAELVRLDKGMGFVIAVSPRDTAKNQPGFAVFFWPKDNPRDIPYETGEGTHTFRNLGTSDNFRIYYSDPAGFMKQEIQSAFCIKGKK